MYQDHVQEILIEHSSTINTTSSVPVIETLLRDSHELHYNITINTTELGRPYYKGHTLTSVLVTLHQYNKNPSVEVTLL